MENAFLRNSSGDVDFVIQKANKVIPIEVKAEENLQSAIF